MRKCEICSKTSKMVGHRKLLRGHYNPTNWTRKYPNLQKAITPEGKKVLACTQCIKTFTKEARMEQKKIDKANKAAQKKAETEKAAKIREEKAKAKEKAKKPKKEKPKKDKETKKPAK